MKNNIKPILIGVVIIAAGIALLAGKPAGRPAQAARPQPAPAAGGSLFVPLVLSTYPQPDLTPQVSHVSRDVVKDGRFILGDGYEWDTFFCGLDHSFCGTVQTISPSRWRISPLLTEPQEFQVVVLYIPDFYGFPAIIFAVNEGCFYWGGLAAYCIDYLTPPGAPKTDFIIWQHPVVPEMAGMYIDIGTPGGVNCNGCYAPWSEEKDILIGTTSGGLQ